MSEKQTKDISVDAVVRFCVEKFLEILKKGKHPDPCIPVVNALMRKYHISKDNAHSLYKPIYWTLMEKKVITYHQKTNGSYWKLEKNNINVGELARAAAEEYQVTMQARIEEYLV